MAIAKSEIGKSNVAILSPDQVSMILANVDTTGLSEEEKYELALVLYEDWKRSSEGFDFRPQRFKIQRESQTFVDSFGNTVEELRGIVIYKQKVRALWEEGEKVPVCSSLDCIRGTTNTGEIRACSSCEFDEWGSADPDDPEKRGKACKEMRRIYLLQKNAQLPIIVSLPPTSLRVWDDFCSARLQMGITDLTTEVVLTLIPATVGKYTVSVIKPKNGARLKPSEILHYAKFQKQFLTKMQTLEISADDYFDSDEAVREPGEDDNEDFPF